jgi:hypothetical protein
MHTQALAQHWHESNKRNRRLALTLKVLAVNLLSSAAELIALGSQQWQDCRRSVRGLTVAVVVDGVGLATLSMNLERERVGEVRHGLAVEGHLPRHHQRGLRKNERGHNRLASVVLRENELSVSFCMFVPSLLGKCSVV